MANQWDLVPWAIGGGAKHSINVARFLAYAAFGGDEGIIGPTDLEVRAQNVPNGTVRVLPGACSILNRGLNIVAEAYAARLPAQDTVAVSPTGSGGGRSDLVVAVIMNPFQDGEPWPDPSPASIEAGTAEFVKTLVIPNVPPSTKTVKELGLGYSAIALARIDIPVSTATITQAMIKDVRQMAGVREKVVSKAGVHATANVNIPNAFAVWPPAATASVEIPEWANYAFLRGTVLAAFLAAGFVDALIKVVLKGPDNVTIDGGFTYINQTIADVDVHSLATGGVRVAIPEAWRGQVGTLSIVAQNGNPSVAVTAVQGFTSFDFEIRYAQEPESTE